MAKKVAVVDDEADFVELVKDILEAQGYEVLPCIGSLRAFETIKEGKPDLVLLDVMMPGRSGWELLDILKMERETCDLPIVITTAVRAATARLSGQPYEVLKKPFDTSELIATVERAIGKP